MLDHLEVRRLLPPHPWRLDVIRKDVLLLEGEEDTCNTHGGCMVNPVVRPARVQGEVGGPAHQQGAEVETPHELADLLPPRFTAQLTTSAPASGRNS